MAKASRHTYVRAIANLSHAITLAPDEYREMARTDADFDTIRDHASFQTLILGLA